MDLQEVLKVEIDEEISLLTNFSNKLDVIIEEVFEEISKKDFEVYLLPYILGNFERNDGNEIIYRNNYYKFSGSYNVGLQVVENDEVLYTLPPLFIKADKKNLSRVNINYLINSVEDKNGDVNNFNRILAMTAKALGDSTKIDSDELKKYLYNINKIFKDYAYLSKNKKIIKHFNIDDKDKRNDPITYDDDIDDFLD